MIPMVKYHLLYQDQKPPICFWCYPSETNGAILEYENYNELVEYWYSGEDRNGQIML